VDLLVHCADVPAAAGQTFLVADGKDLSTPELIQRLASAMGTPARLLPVPRPVLSIGARLLGKSGELAKLTCSLHVDIRHTCELLGWEPPFGLEEGLEQAVMGTRC
jgi:UDP-4-keto-D-QuiNAc 4-reductase